VTLFIASQQPSSIKGAGDPLQGAGYVPAGLGAKACPTPFLRTPMVGREPISADWLLILRAFLFAQAVARPVERRILCRIAFSSCRRQKGRKGEWKIRSMMLLLCAFCCLASCVL
jgi:hypothetical protein